MEESEAGNLGRACVSQQMPKKESNKVHIMKPPRYSALAPASSPRGPANNHFCRNSPAWSLFSQIKTAASCLTRFVFTPHTSHAEQWLSGWVHFHVTDNCPTQQMLLLGSVCPLYFAEAFGCRSLACTGDGQRAGGRSSVRLLVLPLVQVNLICCYGYPWSEGKPGPQGQTQILWQ